MNEMLEKATAIADQIVADRRQLHQMPELGVYNPKTAAYVKRRLDEMGVPHRDCGIHTKEDRDKLRFVGFPDAPASTGVVGLIGRGGPCLLLRADMDGLPMRETTGLEFASQGDTAHMCGHDTHAAMLLGAAQILKGMEDQLPGTVKLMFQPGEEVGYGARTMVEDGLLENPKVDAAMALHIFSQLEVGRMIVFSGVASSAMASYVVRIQGRGGHSSMPQDTVDPALIATQISNALNLIIPREVDPETYATLTVGVIQCGTASNIIPDTADLGISFRTRAPEVYEHLLKRIREIVDHYVKAWRGTYEFIEMKTPSTVCDPDLVAELGSYTEDILGKENIIPSGPVAGTEDFSHVSQHVPSFYAQLGGGASDHYPMHNPNMVIDERSLPMGSAILAHAAVEWLKHHAET